mmetsp:Transcript_76203/g.178778  ORF Transcript_76203/g.178778 Transcript_76203/m.178778 type:complete len:257 (+) Transcript_76203:393-1163(+)
MHPLGFVERDFQPLCNATPFGDVGLFITHNSGGSSSVKQRELGAGVCVNGVVDASEGDGAFVDGHDVVNDVKAVRQGGPRRPELCGTSKYRIPVVSQPSLIPCRQEVRPHGVAYVPGCMDLVCPCLCRRRTCLLSRPSRLVWKHRTRPPTSIGVSLGVRSLQHSIPVSENRPGRQLRLEHRQNRQHPQLGVIENMAVVAQIVCETTRGYAEGNIGAAVAEKVVPGCIHKCWKPRRGRLYRHTRIEQCRPRGRVSLE